MSPKYLDVTKEQLEQFQEMEIDGPFYMLNLLKVKKQVADTGQTGAKAYQVYMKAAQPFFEQSNATVTFFGKAQLALIGPQEMEWDKILIVHYASKADFYKMITTKGYPAHLRKQALEDSRLILCQ